MPRRNLFIILLMALVSLSCYQRATRNPFAATMAEAMNVIQRDYVDDVEPRLLDHDTLHAVVPQQLNRLDLVDDHILVTRIEPSGHRYLPGCGRVSLSVRPS